MELPEKLTLPEFRKVSRLDYASVYAPKSFARDCSRMMEELVKGHINIPYKWRRGFTPGRADLRRIADKGIREHYSGLARELASKMHQEILRRGGVVDLWPDSSSVSYASFPGVDEKYYFDYFAPEYVETGETVYHNCYVAEDLPEFAELDQKRRELQEQWEAARDRYKTHHSRALNFFCTLGVIILPLLVLSVVLEWAMGLTSRVLLPAVAGGGFLNQLGRLLLWPSSRFAYVRAAMTGWEFWFHTALLIGVPALFTATAASNGLDSYRIHRAPKRLRAELLALENDPHYRDLKRENEAHCKRHEALAEEWHRAWFEWVFKQRAAEKN